MHDRHLTSAHLSEAKSPGSFVSYCDHLDFGNAGSRPNIDWASLRLQIHGSQRLFASPWVVAWAEVYLPVRNWTNQSFYLVAKTSSAQPIGVLPLTVQRLGTLRILSIGGPFVPYRSWPVSSDCDARELACAVVADELTRLGHGYRGIHIWPAYEKDESVLALMAALKKNGWHILARPQGAVFEWQLPADIPEFERGRRRLRRIRDYHRRMARLGRVEIRKHGSCDIETWATVIDDLATVEENSWVVKNSGDPKFYGAHNKRFWLSVLRDEFLSNITTVWILYYEGQPVSFSFNFDVCGTKCLNLNRNSCIMLSKVTEHRSS